MAERRGLLGTVRRADHEVLHALPALLCRLRQHFGPQLPVTLVNHPPPPLQALLAQVLLGLQLAIAAVVLTGRQTEPYLRRVGIVLSPDAWQTLQDKKTGILMGVWFIGELLTCVALPWSPCSGPAEEAGCGHTPCSPPPPKPPLHIRRQHRAPEPGQHGRV